MTFVAVLSLVGCKHETTDPTAALLEAQPAGSVSIAKVSLYQAIERPLYGAGPGGIPIVADRDAYVRGFVEPADDFAARSLSAVLVVNGPQGETLYSDELAVSEASTDADLESTFGFDVPAEQLGPDTSMELRVVESSEDGPGGGDPAETTWSDAVEARPSGAITVVVIPLRYNADGSGRLPDTSDEQIQRIHDRMTAMYPASDVEIRVDPVQDWDRRIQAFSQQDWSQVLYSMAVQRYNARRDEGANTYYYGMFAPEPTEELFCRFGCILGLSLVAQNPGDTLFQASVGISYPGRNTADTLVHEVGHAHGREHAPCNLYGQPSDRNYPHPGAVLGAWGYDPFEHEMIQPNQTFDMMGYCKPLWVSDYTFDALFERIGALEEIDARAARRRPVSPRKVWTVDDAGEVTLLGDAPLAPGPNAETVRVRIVGPDGEVAGRADGRLVPFGDGGGGWLVVDARVPEGYRPELD